MMTSIWSLFISVCLALDICVCCCSHKVLFSLEKNKIRQHFALNNSQIPNWVVEAKYQDLNKKTGWGVLEFTINPEIDREIIAYMTGYAEGDLTRLRIAQHWNNTIGNFCQSVKSQSCKKLNNFLQENIKWMNTMVKKNPSDPLWKEVKYILLQLQGLIDGYNRLDSFDPTNRIRPFGLLLLQLAGDLAEIETALRLDIRLSERLIGSGSCSAFVKVVKDSHPAELYTAHATWTDYNMMLRFIKRYNFPGHTEVFSGYPGMLFSGDDFYLLSSGLVAMETTNGNYNSALWKKVVPQNLLEWVRTIMSNRLAKTGEEWCSIFEQHNSGTYNNQWMIVDYNKFNSGSPDKILYVLEQLPGQIEYKDMTDTLLHDSYWASYNIPYFHIIYEKSGMPDLVKKYGDFFTHDKSPRAKIFARDHKKVTDINSLIKLMRYNDFKNDPAAMCNCTPPYSATNAIAARCDLNDPNGIYPIPVLKQRNHGATDFKATSSQLLSNFTLIAECGPTHDKQPIFQWSKSPYANSSHEGHPDKFDFKPERITWNK